MYRTTLETQSDYLSKKLSNVVVKFFLRNKNPSCYNKITMKIIKITVLGIICFAIRFAFGGFLMMGVGIDPTSILFGLSLTLMAFVIAFLLLKFVMKPTTIKEALMIAGIWVAIVLILDTILEPIVVGITISEVFGEIQTWTRAFIILLAAPFSFRKP